MTPALLAQHQARKARLQRFADAAYRHQTKNSAPADVIQIGILEKALDKAPEAQRIKVSRREYEKPDRPSVYLTTMQKILRAVADEFDMSIDEILSRHQQLKFTTPRFVAIGLMIELTQLSLPAIGRHLGGRDHTTIISGRRRINKLLESEAFRNRFDQIKASIVSGTGASV